MNEQEESESWGWIDYCLGGLVAAVVVLVLLEVLSRYVLQYSFFFSEEITRFLFIWMVFLGGSVAVKRAAHFKLDAFAKLLRPSSARWFQLTRDVCVVLFSLLLLIGGVRVVQLNLQNLSPALALPMGYVYAIVPISAALSTCYAGCQLIRTLRGVMPRSEADRSGGSGRSADGGR